MNSKASLLPELARRRRVRVCEAESCSPPTSEEMESLRPFLDAGSHLCSHSFLGVS